MSRLRIIKNQKISILVLSFLILTIYGIHYFQVNSPTLSSLEEIPSDLLLLQSNLSDYNKNKKNYTSNFTKKPVSLKKFNPNELDLNGWINLGFSEKQSATILKFKSIKGGNFSSKEDLKECFVISQEKFDQIEPYISIKKVPVTKKKIIKYPKKEEFKNNYKIKPFDPNLYSQKDWQSIGFSEKQAQAILKYKNILGGSFTSKEQIKKCFVISPEKFQEISPFINIKTVNSEIKIEAEKPIVKETKVLRKEINSARFQDFEPYGLPDDVKGKLLGFRKGLGGFVRKEQIYEVYGMPREIADKINSEFDLDLSKVIKININNSPDETILKHIYLRKYAKKILEQRKIKPLSKEDLSEIINSKDFDKIVLYLEF